MTAVFGREFFGEFVSGGSAPEPPAAHIGCVSVRCELWSTIQAAGGVRLSVAGFIPYALAIFGTRSLTGTEALTFTVPATAEAATIIKEGQVLRIWRSDTDFEEWPVGPVVATRSKGGKVDVTCQPLLYRLGTCGIVTEYQTAPEGGAPQLEVGVVGLTPTEIIQTYILDHPEISAELPWLSLGTIEPTTPIALSWNAATPLQVLRALIDAIQATGELCELQLRRVSTTSYAIDILHEIGSTAPVVSLRIRRNLQSLEMKTDPTDRATRIMPIAATLAGEGTFLGYSRWRIVSVSSGPKTLVLEDPAAGAGPIGFDDQLIGWYLLRERTGETALIDDSVASTQTLTLHTWITGLAAGEYIDFRQTEPATGIQGSGNGAVPYYLEHPIYASTTPPGIGVKFGTIDRGSVVGVPNMCGNAVMRTWSDSGELPDNWHWSPGFAGASAGATAFPASGSFAQNTDPLYTQLGGQSLYFAMKSGTIMTPDLPLAPIFVGQRLSFKLSLILTAGWDATVHRTGLMALLLGIRLADGTIKRWYEDSRIKWLAPVQRSPSIAIIAGGSWLELGIIGNDITAPSTAEPAYAPVTQADIDALPVDALGFVVMLYFTSSSATPIEGYLDAAMINLGPDVAPEITEFGRANELWEGTNAALDLLAPPQITFSVDTVDLARLNPTLTEDELVLGGGVRLNDAELGLVNTPQRIVEVRTNHQVPGDTKVILASRARRLTDLLRRDQARQDARSSAITNLQNAAAASTGGTITGTATPPPPLGGYGFNYSNRYGVI